MVRQMKMSDNQVKVYLPPSTDVVVKGFTNSANPQRITLQPPTGTPFSYEGHGEQNKLIGTSHFTTPSGGQPALGVTVEYSKDNGATWLPSEIFADSCTIRNLELFVVVSEDQVDEDFNDAVCMVSWPEAQPS